MVEVGDLIGVSAHPSFNHGCTDWAVLRYAGDGKAVVIAAESCHSCWQVGHDADHVFAEIGDVWDDLNLQALEPAGQYWSTDIQWQFDCMATALGV